ncbi:alanine racemase [Proteus mirabilis]|uniref:alanine racemase n=1 Tax=Proteus mirabilis TaxID=584 RepID=UPI002575DF9C|nr:alanine racemase [Proteus mirabilis]MDM3668011.1 alanine racemase [Proteus mirabilis]
MQLFQAFIQVKAGDKSLAASAGILFWQQVHYKWVRPGIITYGISPTVDNRTGQD